MRATLASNPAWLPIAAMLLSLAATGCELVLDPAHKFNAPTVSASSTASSTVGSTASSSGSSASSGSATSVSAASISASSSASSASSSAASASSSASSASASVSSASSASSSGTGSSSTSSSGTTSSGTTSSGTTSSSSSSSSGAMPGWCAVDGGFIAPGLPDPSNLCLSCENDGGGEVVLSHSGSFCPGGQCDTMGDCITTCTIHGSSYSDGDLDPDAPCLSCNPLSTTTAWYPAVIGSACLGGGVCALDAGCQYDCLVDGEAALDGEPNPLNACQLCSAAQPSAWVDLLAEDACGTGGVCLPDAPPVCTCGMAIESSATALCMDPQSGAQGDCSTIVPSGSPAQDGLVRLNPPQLTFETDGGRVLDLVTGLEWQTEAFSAQGPNLEPDGGDVCSTLPVEDGGTPWRLPTVDEMLSLLDFGTAQDATPPGFGSDAGDIVWTRDLSVPDGGTWQVHFSTISLFRFPASIPAAVYCVRPSGPTCSRGPLAATDAGIAVDSYTGLTWTTAPFAPATWGDALETCATLDATALNSFPSGWRVPAAKELASVVRFGQLTSPLVDPALHLDLTDTFEWSSTPFIGSTNVVGMDLDQGYGGTPSVLPWPDGGNLQLIPFHCVH